MEVGEELAARQWLRQAFYGKQLTSPICSSKKDVLWLVKLLYRDRRRTVCKPEVVVVPSLGVVLFCIQRLVSYFFSFLPFLIFAHSQLRILLPAADYPSKWLCVCPQIPLIRKIARRLTLCTSRA